MESSSRRFEWVWDEVQSVIRTLFPKCQNISLEMSFNSDLGLDSLQLLEFVATLENKFSISIPTESLFGLSTISDFVELLLSSFAPSNLPDIATGEILESV